MARNNSDSENEELTRRIRQHLDEPNDDKHRELISTIQTTLEDFNKLRDGQVYLDGDTSQFSMVPKNLSTKLTEAYPDVIEAIKILSGFERILYNEDESLKETNSTKFPHRQKYQLSFFSDQWRNGDKLSICLTADQESTQYFLTVKEDKGSTVSRWVVDFGSCGNMAPYQKRGVEAAGLGNALLCNIHSYLSYTKNTRNNSRGIAKTQPDDTDFQASLDCQGFAATLLGQGSRLAKMLLSQMTLQEAGGGDMKGVEKAYGLPEKTLDGHTSMIVVPYDRKTILRTRYAYYNPEDENFISDSE